MSMSLADQVEFGVLAVGLLVVLATCAIAPIVVKRMNRAKRASPFGMTVANLFITGGMVFACEAGFGMLGSTLNGARDPIGVGDGIFSGEDSLGRVVLWLAIATFVTLICNIAFAVHAFAERRE
jgi:hypothetical protein